MLVRIVPSPFSLLLSICLTSLLLPVDPVPRLQGALQAPPKRHQARQIGPALDYPQRLGANLLRHMPGAIRAHDESHQYLF
jgi:hypothetical protein